MDGSLTRPQQQLNIRLIRSPLNVFEWGGTGVKFRNIVWTGVAAAGLLIAGGQSYKVLGEKPAFYQYQGGHLIATQIGQYDSGSGEGGTEILAYDEKLKRAFVTNGEESAIDVVSFERLESGVSKHMKRLDRIHLAEFDIRDVDDITSVAVHPERDLVALSVVSDPKTDPGYVVLLTKDGKFVDNIKVGALPDMVTFTPDGKKLLVANEGEPADDYSVDPEGSISVIDLDTLAAKTLTFEGAPLDDKVRVSSEGSVLQQLEPEYITVSDDSKTAFVTLQENNAIATVDLENETIIDVKGLGVKNHSLPGNELDGKENGETKLERLPLLGLYMPDAIDTFTAGGETYIVTPNEGDARDYDAYSEEADIGDIADLIRLNADHYKGFNQKQLDRLVDKGLLDELADTKITLENGLNEDGEYEALYTYGGRSFSIFDAETMELVYDSGNEFEKITSKALPEFFNTTNDEIAYDDRSSSKGPEPETVVTGDINGKTYAFIALERTSGIMVYDLSRPEKPKFVTFITSRDFSEDVKGDVSPEGLQFIPADASPTGKPLLAATHEVSGTVAVYEFESTKGKKK
nr:choice-of-anchor I family protein [Bhargavaea ginsengi]